MIVLKKKCVLHLVPHYLHYAFRICNSDTDKHYLRDKMKQLRDKKKQLRDKKKQLRDKEKQLRDTEDELLEWQWDEG